MTTDDLRGRRGRPHDGSERGGALVITLIIGVMLISLASVIVQRTGTEAKSADQASEFEGALHAAEAGLNDYIAKTTEDHLYYSHFVHPAEDTRARLSGGTVAAGTAWPGDPSWTYPTRKQTWRALANNAASLFEYNLAVIPPGNGNPAMTITASGRRRSSPRYVRTIEVQVRGASVADFQMISNAFVRYGQTTTTNGRVYGAQDIDYNGIARADVMAEGDITNSLSPPATFSTIPLARKCDSSGTTGCNIRDVVKNPIQFNSFATSLSEVQYASTSAAGGGINLPNTAGVDGWRLTFVNNGTVTVDKCTKNGTNDLAAVAPASCTAFQTKPVPTIGAIYADQTVLVRGVIKGRVTVVSNQDIDVIDDISYVDGTKDVLGLIADKNVFMAQYSPDDLTWQGAVIARQGAMKLWNCGGALKNGTMTFVGSQATFLTPCTSSSSGGVTVGGFAVRSFSYDPNLLYLQPPFFPVLEEAYTILRYREVDG